MEAKSGGFSAHDEMFTGEPDAGNLQVRFDEGEWQARRKAPATLYSTENLAFSAVRQRAYLGINGSGQGAVSGRAVRL